MTTRQTLLILLCGSLAVAQPHFTSVDSTGVPYAIIITDVNVAGDGLISGAEIAVFDDTLCVGVGVFQDNYNFQFSAWEGNQSQELAGFIAGAEMQFRIWTQHVGIWQEFEATPIYEVGDGTFKNGIYSVLSLKVEVTGIEGDIQNTQPTSFDLGAFPNPFNASISFPVILPEYSTAELRINSLEGRELWYRKVRGSAQLSWFGVDQQGISLSSGVYLVTLRSGSQQVMERITLLK